MYLPDRKSALEISNVEATRPAVSTRLFGPKSMPLGLSRNMRPFAVSLPNIEEGSTPITRFKAMLEDDGCKKCTASGTPIEKLLYSADDPAFLVYTSGTTGLPKGALHAHRCIPGRLTGLEMAQNSMRLPWMREEVDDRLRLIMKSIHKTCVEVAARFGTPGNYVNGANIGGFLKVADAMMDQGVV